MNLSLSFGELTIYLSQETGFDLALFSHKFNTICLIECKSELTSRLERKVNEFQRKIDFLEKNSWIEVQGNQLRIKSYFEQALRIEEPHFYYVLASELVDLGSSFNDLIQISEYPFDMWRSQLVYNGIRIQRTPIPSRKDRERRVSISPLTAYLDKIHSPVGNTIQICLSSNKYYLTVQSCINLQRLELFTFQDFIESFSVDFKDYEGFEKRFLFESFVKFGEECNLLKILKDTGDVLTSSYVIINRGKQSAQLRDNIISKMARRKARTDPVINAKIEEQKKILIRQIFYKREPLQKRLTDFAD